LPAPTHDNAILKRIRDEFPPRYFAVHIYDSWVVKTLKRDPSDEWKEVKFGSMMDKTVGSSLQAY
jgi:hypothetical protein